MTDLNQETMETELEIYYAISESEEESNFSEEMPKTAKSKSAKEDNDSKKSKSKKASDEPDGFDNRDDTNPTSLGETSNTAMSEHPKPESSMNNDEIEEIKYEEPVLTLIIVEKYEGEKDKGFFEGIGKAEFQGGHFYEGEFHNGMMCGKGKYVWSSGITYEGDFINNEITGNGKYIWIDTKYPNETSKHTIYEGDVYKGKRNGFGKFKASGCLVTYIGEWKMGKRYGKGKMIYDANGLSYYEGDWIDNKKFGWGIRKYPSGNIYEGMWVNDVRHGEGTMRWFDKNQTYSGQWENGVQNGFGEHNWYLARVEMTQYSLRNTYYGNFLNGKRHGQGTFLYADGSKYEGTWENNLKHGWGKFTYKDGQVYEGYFEEDKITDSPTFNRTSKISNEIAKIKNRIPSAGKNLNIHLLRATQQTNRSDFHLKLDLNSILNDFNADDKKILEINQAHKTMIRYLDLFKQIYRFYSQLGMNDSPDNTYRLNRMQFWRFMKDCKIHLNENTITLMEFDRLLNPDLSPADLHCPYDKILIREFFNYIVLIAYHLYKNQFDGNGLITSWCIEKLIENNILPNCCNVQGYFYIDTRKTINVLNYMVQAYDVYKLLCAKRKVNK